MYPSHADAARIKGLILERIVHDRHGAHNPKETMNPDDFIAGIAVMRALSGEAVR
jgi:hypothetical protein